MEEIIEALGFGEEDEIVAPHMPMDFGTWVAEERDFINIPSSKELKDKQPEDAKHILRQKALMLITRFFDAVCVKDLMAEGNTLNELLEQEEWLKAMDDFIEDDQYAFYSNEDAGSWQADDEEADEAQIELDEAIANNAIAELEKKIEGAELTEEEFAIGLANESGIEMPETDTDASVDSFIESITNDDHVHGPDCEHSYGEQVPVTRQEVPGSYLLWKWEIKAVIEKHKAAIDDGHPVTALANGAKELVESGAVTTKGGLLDALLELIEAKPADALIIVKCFEQLK